MHLVLGHPDDSCCAAVVAALEGRGSSVRRVEAALAALTHLQLRIGLDGHTTVALALADGPVDEIESVLVRGIGSVDPTGWDRADHAYIQAEHQAATLAWLSALDCPVVNPVTADAWYRPRMPLLSWLRRLRASGLPTPEILVTDSAETVEEFRRALASRGVPGAIFRSLARDEAWLVGPGDWGGLRALQVHAPVCLAEPHGATTLLCVVGGVVVWNAAPSPEALALTDQLLSFAHDARLTFVEIALAEVRSGLAVVHVDPLPMLERFERGTQGRIVEALTDLLTGQKSPRLAEEVS